MEIMNMTRFVRRVWDDRVGQDSEDGKTAEEEPITDRRLHLNDELRVGVGKALELVLVQIHDEEFIGWSELHCHLGELLVEVARVAAILLEIGEKRGKRKGGVGHWVTERTWCL